MGKVEQAQLGMVKNTIGHAYDCWLSCQLGVAGCIQIEGFQWDLSNLNTVEGDGCW